MSEDMKGYTTDPDMKWLYPPTHMPPPGDLYLLNCGGVSIRGTWRWDGSVVAWRKLFKRDLEAEAAAINYIKVHK